MDYASHALLPSLGSSGGGHFRVRAGRPVIPFSCSAKWFAEKWPELRHKSARFVAALYRLGIEL